MSEREGEREAREGKIERGREGEGERERGERGGREREKQTDRQTDREVITSFYCKINENDCQERFEPTPLLL